MNENNLFVILNNYALLQHYWYTVYISSYSEYTSHCFCGIFLLLFIDCKSKNPFSKPKFFRDFALFLLYHEFIEDNTQKKHLWNDLKQFNFIHFYTNLKCAIFAFLFLFQDTSDDSHLHVCMKLDSRFLIFFSIKQKNISFIV